MQQISPIKQRILQYLDFKSISKYKFYQDSGITRSVLDKDSGISEDNVAKFIAYAPEVSIEWLIKGDGEMLNDGSSFSKPAEVFKLKTDINQELQQIPLYDIESTLGVTAVFKNLSNTKPIDYLYVPNAPKCDGAIYASGDSMYPLIKSGDIISYKIIEDFINDIYWGEKYVISIDMAGDDYITTKFVQKSEKGDSFIKLVSHNKHHQDKDIPLKKVKAMALVKIVVRYETTR